MKKKYIGPSILYKRPISKNTNLFNSIIPKPYSNKPHYNSSYLEQEEMLDNKNIEKVHPETSRLNFNYLNSNFKNIKNKNENNSNCYTGRYSINSQTKKLKFKPNYNENKNENSLFFQNKDEENKIFPNYNNNTCNISLNQHFYNIDYNNFAQSKSINKNDGIEGNIIKSKNKNTPKLNINYNNVYINKAFKNNNIYFNSSTNNIPIELVKDTNNSYDSFDNYQKTFLWNKFNLKNNKKANKINLIINPDKKLFNIDKRTILNNYTNIVKKIPHSKIKDKINLTTTFDTKKFPKTNSSGNYSLKYEKKIITHQSLNKNKDKSYFKNLSIFKNISNDNYNHQIAFLNRSQEQIKNKKRIFNKISLKNHGYNSFILNKINSLNHKKILNSSGDNNLNEKNNFNPKKNNNNKKINLNSINNFNSKKEASKNVSEKKNYLKSSHNNYNNKRPQETNIIYKSDLLFGKKLEKISNHSINKTNQLYLSFKKDMTNGNLERLNTTKNIESKKIGINIINNKKRLKKIELNDIINNRKAASKYNIGSSRREKESMNLKKMFIDHFSTEGNEATSSNNISSSRKINLNQNNKIQYFKQKAKKKVLNTENNNNISLTELLKKIRVTKCKLEKNTNNKLNKKKIIKGNVLNKIKLDFKQSNSQNNITQKSNLIKASKKLKDENISNISETSTKTKETNEYLEQSIKLSNYIKEYFSKYNSYPGTNLNFYRIGRVIGQGGFAKVNLGLNVLTGRVVAIKSFNKTIKTKNGDKINMDKILYEINLMRKLNHQNITKILETFENEQFFFIIMEYINGGNLFSYIKKRRKLSEKVAKFLFRQIILGIKHIHSQLIVHRDIKLENILIDMNNNIKICDFGIGIILSSEDQDLYSQCGTPLYIAPEIILSNKEKGYKGFPVDIWSAGIALYLMVSGKLPFNMNDSTDDFDMIEKNKSIKEKNMKLKYEILHKEPKYIENISDELRDLLKGLLNKNPKKRLTCDEILNHPWLSDQHSYKILLFTKAEKKLLYETYRDYRKNDNTGIIENFTLSNLFKDKDNKDGDKNNYESKSSLLDPFNSINYSFFNIQFINSKKGTNNYKFDDFKNNKLFIEKDILEYSNKAKEFNVQYELDNNQKVDNGVLINTTNNSYSNSSSFSNTYTNRNLIIDRTLNLDSQINKLSIINPDKFEKIIGQIESFGYDREYVIKSIKNNFLNHATTIFFLLLNYEKI